MTMFYLVRHGEPDFHRNGTLIFKGEGINFSPLSETGRQQIRNIADEDYLGKCEIILSSPYTRSLESAAILSRILNIRLKVEATLFEWSADKNFMPFEEDKEDDRLLEYNRFNGEYPPGETREWENNTMMRKRVTDVMDRYLHYKKVIIFCHGILIHSFFPDRWSEYAEITKLIYEGE